MSGSSDAGRKVPSSSFDTREWPARRPSMAKPCICAAVYGPYLRPRTLIIHFDIDRIPRDFLTVFPNSLRKPFGKRAPPVAIGKQAPCRCGAAARKSLVMVTGEPLVGRGAGAMSPRALPRDRP